MRDRVSHGVGVDIYPSSLALATTAGGDVEYVRGDFLTHDFGSGSFDYVASVAALHHMDVEPASARMRRLLRPGGVLAVVGVARRSHADSPYDAAGFFAHRLLKVRHGYWQHPCPVADPTMTHRQVRNVVARVLPGARYRQHVLFRFSVVWGSPLAD